MPRHHHHQPLSRGFTLPELVVGIVFVGIVSLVLARLILAFASITNYTLRQTAVLASARQALVNKGQYHGMVWTGREAYAIRALSTTTLQMTTTGPYLVDYYLSTGTLVQMQNGVVAKQASGLTDLNVTYYEIGGDGRIFESTVAAQASLANFTLTVTGKNSKLKTYKICSAAALRNK